MTESPRKRTHLQVIRQPSRGRDDSFDADEYANEYYNFQERRGSSQSISRYSSCPQLAEVEETPNQPYEKTVDDINTHTGALNREMKRVVVQGPSPLLKKKVFLENGQISDTPTPPSTPRSRRSLMSSHESLLSSPDKTFVGGSPFVSPRLLRRQQMDRHALSRESSCDSLNKESPEVTIKKLPLSIENVQKLGESAEKRKPVSREVDGSGKPKVGTLGTHDEPADTVHKCEHWLQTLNLVQTDRLKSRSHIQLPPI